MSQRSPINRGGAAPGVTRQGASPVRRAVAGSAPLAHDDGFLVKPLGKGKGPTGEEQKLTDGGDDGMDYLLPWPTDEEGK